jgi:hypothetical protein
MTTKVLAEATKQFDAPMVVDRSRPLKPSQLEQWKRVKRKLRGDHPKAGDN